jgi:hypothetical protein
MNFPHLSDFLKSENLIASIAALIAFAALIVSWRSLVFSKLSYSIAKKDHDEKYHDINPYLIEAVKWTNDKNEIYASFAVSYANRANLPTSLTNIELEVTWRGGDGTISSAYVQADSATYPLGRSKKLQTITLPLNLSERETKSGWLSYKIPLLKNERCSIDGYRLVASSINGSKISVETYLLLTLDHENS